MALTRKLLKSMGIDEEKIDQIIEAHSETVDALKEERDKYKVDAEKVPGIQMELDAFKEAAEKNEGKNPYKVKYDALKEEFEAFKADTEKKAAKAVKEDAYKALLKEVGVSEKRITAVLKVSDIDSVELDKDGKIKDADALKKSIKEEWSDFIPTTGTQGANTTNPPANSNNKVLAKEEIMKIKDTQERQQAWADAIRNGGI